MNILRSIGSQYWRVSTQLREVILLACMAFVVFLAYSNTFGVPYILDDEPHILLNPVIRLTDLTWNNLFKVGFNNVNANRPVANLSFGLNYFFHRYSIAGYHLVNFLIHITTGFLLYFFIKTTISLPSIRDKHGSGSWLPFAAAFIWMLHPIQTQSVTYIVQRMNSLEAMFYILAMVCYTRARLADSPKKRWLFFGGSLISGILALGSKETAVTLPVFILLYEWYFFQGLSLSWLRSRYFYPAMVFIALVGLVYLYVGEEPFTTIMAGYQERDFTLGQRILTEFRVVVFYLSLIFFPHPSRMNLDHHFLISTSLLTPGVTLLSLAVILWLIGLSVGLAQRQRLLSFCILWYLGNLVIESSVVGLEIAFEHRNYVPSMLVILGGIVLASPFLRIRGIKEVALVFVILLLSFWTYERNWIWGNEIRLWADSAQKSPQKVRPHNNLGTSMFKQGRAREAIVNYSKVLQIDPDHAIAHNNLGFVMARLQRVKSAIMHYSEALRIKPDYKRAYINLSSALRREPHLKRELSSFNSLDLAESLLDRGNALAEMGDINGALEQFSEALRVNPDHQEVHFQKGRLLASQSRIDESIHHFSEALQINPDDAEAHFNMGIALAGKGRLKGAARHFEEALRLNPEDMEARRNLTVLQQTIEASDKAREAESFGVGLRIKPDYKKVQFDLGGPPAKH